MPFERGLQAEVVEHAGPQAKGEIADRAEIRRRATTLGEAGADAAVAAQAFDAAQAHPETGQDLGDVVVQLA